MNKKIFAIIFGILVIGALAYAIKTQVSKPNQAENAGEQKVSVVTSFYPLADFARNIGGDFAEVTNITPSGTEPHDYEPTPQDIAKIYQAKLFIMNGNGVDAWADKLETKLKNRGVAVVKITDYVEALESNNPEQEEEALKEEHEEESKYDPHVWLDPINVQKQADIIADALIKIDNARQKEYTKNKDQFKQKLAELDEQYKNGLANCQLRQIVTSHNAFNYLANRYNLSTLYILGLSPDEEPSPQSIANVATIAKEKNVKYVFFETLVNPKLSETLASEIGAQTLVLNPIESLTNEEITQGKNYISVMKDNLINLRTALSCQ